MRIYGKDFQSIAEVIGTKNESQLNQFYTNYRKKFNLDDVLKEFEARQLKEQKQQQHQQHQQQLKLNEAQQQKSSNTTNIAKNSSDVKTDVKKLVSDDEIMEVSKEIAMECECLFLLCMWIVY